MTRNLQESRAVKRKKDLDSRREAPERKAAPRRKSTEIPGEKRRQAKRKQSLTRGNQLKNKRNELGSKLTTRRRTSLAKKMKTKSSIQDKAKEHFKKHTSAEEMSEAFKKRRRERAKTKKKAAAQKRYADFYESQKKLR
jgi:hypothetical protein